MFFSGFIYSNSDPKHSKPPQYLCSIESAACAGNFRVSNPLTTIFYLKGTCSALSRKLKNKGKKNMSKRYGKNMFSIPIIVDVQSAKMHSQSVTLPNQSVITAQPICHLPSDQKDPSPNLVTILQPNGHCRIK